MMVKKGKANCVTDVKTPYATRDIPVLGPIL
jgi:hypothetical protein